MGDVFDTNEDNGFESVNTADLLSMDNPLPQPTSAAEPVAVVSSTTSSDDGLETFGLGAKQDESVEEDTQDSGMDLMQSESEGPADTQDLLLDIGNPISSEVLQPAPAPALDMEEITPTAEEPSPPPSPVRKASPPPAVKSEPIQKTEEPAMPISQEKPAATQKADSTTLSEKPVEMPKATMEPSRPGRCSSNSCSYSAWISSLDHRVLDLLLWRNPLVTGPVLAVSLAVLLSLTCCSVFSVVSYLLLATLCAALATRVYKYFMVMLHKGEDVHPFKDMLDYDLEFSEQTVQECAGQVVQRLNSDLAFVRNLILVKEVIPSLKLGLVLYFMTYIGAWFNGLTLVILVFFAATVAAFTLPKVYEVNKSQIDQYVDIAQAKFDDTYKQLQSKVPFLKSKQKTQ